MWAWRHNQGSARTDSISVMVALGCCTPTRAYYSIALRSTLPRLAQLLQARFRVQYRTLSIVKAKRSQKGQMLLAPQRWRPRASALCNHLKAFSRVVL